VEYIIAIAIAPQSKFGLSTKGVIEVWFSQKTG
jgi:hypothetical protein